MPELDGTTARDRACVDECGQRPLPMELPDKRFYGISGIRSGALIVVATLQICIVAALRHDTLVAT